MIDILYPSDESYETVNCESEGCILLEETSSGSILWIGCQDNKHAISNSGLKKAHQSCENITANLQECLSSALSTAFQHFTSTIQTKELEVCCVQQEYLNLGAHIVVTDFLTKLKFLYTFVEEQCEHPWNDEDIEDMLFRSSALNELAYLLGKHEIPLQSCGSLVMMELHWLPLHHRITFKLCTLMHGIHHGHCPKYMKEMVLPVSRGRSTIT